MRADARIRWGRIVAGGVLIEVVLILLTVPILLFADISVVPVVAPPACFVIGFLIPWWLLRKVPYQPILHGFLMGIVATAIYLGLVFGQSGSFSPVIEMYGPSLFVLANGLRIVGAIAGSAVASRGRSREYSA